MRCISRGDIQKYNYYQLKEKSTSTAEISGQPPSIIIFGHIYTGEVYTWKEQTCYLSEESVVAIKFRKIG